MKSLKTFDAFIDFLADPDRCGLIIKEGNKITTKKVQEALEIVMKERDRKRRNGKKNIENAKRETDGTFHGASAEEVENSAEVARKNEKFRGKKDNSAPPSNKEKESKLNKTKVKESTKEKTVDADASPPPPKKANDFNLAMTEIDFACVHTFGKAKEWTPEAKAKLKTRLQKFSGDDLASAFRNLKNEPDGWKLDNNGWRSLTWWLHCDERIRQMQDCHRKKMHGTKPPTVDHLGGISL